MTLTMYDSIDLGQIPHDAEVIAGYVSGHWPTARTIPSRFPHARMLTIAVNASHDADVLDIETGDATPAQAAAWYEQQKRRGVARPCLYASASVMQADVVPVIRAAGISRHLVRLWSAHYTFKAHICGPATCRAMSISADGTQWTDRSHGRNLDESLLADGFFGTAPVQDWQEAMMNALPTLGPDDQDHAGSVAFVRRIQALVKVVGDVNKLPAASAVAANGKYDQKTHAGVLVVQKFFGLSQDGVVGPATWAALVAGQHP